jgi:hypothetical protein
MIFLDRRTKLQLNHSLLGKSERNASTRVKQGHQSELTLD